MATLARVAVALSAADKVARSRGRMLLQADLAPEDLSYLPEPARRLVHAAVTPLSRSPAVRARLVRLLNQEPRRNGPAEPSAERAEKSTLAPRALSSRYAGLAGHAGRSALHDLPALLSPAALHHALAAALGPEIWERVRLDPVLAALAPFDPRGPEATFPPVPEPLRAAVPEERRDGEASGEGAAGWAACLIHAFAAGLRGFEASSLSYLRRQFLARPGTLHLAERQLTLVLDPLPLGIVLRVGIHGWTGRLPQARNPLFRIEIGEG